MTTPRGLHVYLNVADVARSARFYDALGFRRAFEFPEPMNVIGYGLGDAASTLLIGPAEPAENPETRKWLSQKPWGVGTVIMPQVESVDAVYQNAQRAGLQVDEPPADQPWGSRTLRITDPDGYSLMFDQPTAPPPSRKPARRAKKAKKAARKSAARSPKKAARKASKKARRR